MPAAGRHSVNKKRKVERDHICNDARSSAHILISSAQRQKKMDPDPDPETRNLKGKSSQTTIQFRMRGHLDGGEGRGARKEAHLRPSPSETFITLREIRPDRTRSETYQTWVKGLPYLTST